MYSTFVAGSDQIWNIGCSGNDTTYFLDFVEQEKRKISYGEGHKVRYIENILKKEYLISHH